MKVSNSFKMIGKCTVMFSTLLLALLFIVVFSARSASAQTVQTDRANYSAGDIAEFSGSGWDAGESVALEIVGDPASDPDAPPDTLYSVADDYGNISNQYIIPGHGFDQTFTLTATGSGSSAHTSFTNSLNSAPPPAPEIENSVLATVMTDKDDYAPGEIVQMTGSGWEPGETVELYLVGEPATHDPETIYAEADGAGNFFAEYVVQDYDLNRSFTLTATGMSSGLVAQTTFTDAELVTSEVTATVNDVTVVAGGPAVMQTINLTATGAISAAITSGNPSTAQVMTVYTFTAGVLSFNTFSSAFNFFSSGTGCGGQNCTVTWTGAPTPYSVMASFSADAATTPGDYVITLSEAAGTTLTIDPAAQGGKLDDPVATLITVHVEAPAGGECGDGNLDDGEDCDLGEENNGQEGSCCTVGCEYASSDTVCRPGSGECDPLDENCVACDPDEYCTGGSDTCPDDVVTPEDTVCREGSGEICDPEDVDCVVCDPDEACSGDAGEACPDDVVEPATTVCRAAVTEQCDQAENCTGNSGEACPVDIKYPSFFGGFNEPIANPGPYDGLYVWNWANAGRTFPAKFTEKPCADGAPDPDSPNICDPDGLQYNPLRYKEVMCPNGDVIVDPIPLTSSLNTGGTTLRCVDGMYLENWDTPKSFKGKCIKLKVEFEAGNGGYALFDFRK